MPARDGKLDPDWQYTKPDQDDPIYHTRCSLCSERLFFKFPKTYKFTYVITNFIKKI